METPVAEAPVAEGEEEVEAEEAGVGDRMALVGKGGTLEEMCSMLGGPCRSQRTAALALAGSSENSDVVNQLEGYHGATRAP